MSTLAAPKSNADACLDRYRMVRSASETMCAGLEPAEYRLQPIGDVSPPWWNLGHTSWFFARNVLRPYGGEWNAEDERYDYLLNSYYASLGERLARERRGSVTRPTTEEIYAYRRSVDERVEKLVASIEQERLHEMSFVLRIGIEHEQQHQELFYTEIKYILFQNSPALRRKFSDERSSHASPCELIFQEYEGGLFEFGHQGDDWCWDNELPPHEVRLYPFALGCRLVSCGEYLEFIEDGGYQNQLLWLDNGWRHCELENWQAPLYWERIDNAWQVFTLQGQQALDRSAPVEHVSFYEADAFARWRAETYSAERGVRLPREFEWEHAARSSGSRETSDAKLERDSEVSRLPLRDMHRTLWQWTQSYYEPYPGYRPFPGVLAEYNGKFMDNQRVLRGGSFATPEEHYRTTYRNFWSAHTRFQFTGIRLAKDA